MRTKMIILSIGLLLSGCSAVVNSRDIALDLRSTKNLTIGLNKNDIDTSRASQPSRKTARAGIATSRASQPVLLDTLLSESKGMVSEFTNQPLILSFAFDFHSDFQASALIGVPSFFLPFLAFVPESNSEIYRINYVIRDRAGNVVHQRSLQGTVEGTIKGYFVGRIDAATKLKALEAQFAAKNGARLILKDIDENSEKLFAAANAVPIAPVSSASSDNKSEPITQPSAASDEDSRACQQAKSLNTLNAYAEFLRTHPSTPSRREALAAMSLLIKNQKGSYKDYKKFIDEYEDGMEFVPSQYCLALTGPKGMRVHDLLRLLKQGIEDKVIAAKIRMQNGIYKDFGFEEIGTLKKMGMTGVLIEAMLDSTTRAKREHEELQKKKEMENLLAEIQRTQKKLDAMKTAQEQQQSGTSASVGQSGDPSLGDTVKNCAAQIVALEACKNLPWYGQALCKVAAKSKFPCQ